MRCTQAEGHLLKTKIFELGVIVGITIFSQLVTMEFVVGRCVKPPVEVARQTDTCRHDAEIELDLHLDTSNSKPAN